jgi:predicted restriction endonuclease
MSTVSLLDAHSFAWMLSVQMEREGKLPDVDEYLDLSETERIAIVNARVGQGRFRSALIEYWSCCAVTGCAEIALLRASHIKPWSKGTLTERLSLYNGLLLSPSLDACFDSGYVTFSDDGRIQISNRLSEQDARSLGLRADMRLSKIDPQHQPYLKYHREHVFKSSSR